MADDLDFGVFLVTFVCSFCVKIFKFPHKYKVSRLNHQGGQVIILYYSRGREMYLSGEGDPKRNRKKYRRWRG